MEEKTVGSCLCGQIKFEAGEMFPEAGHCHCSMCRKFSGAAFSTFVSVAMTGFRWLQGEDLLTRYVADNKTQRTFCRQCGSSLLFKSPNASDDIIEIALGAINSDVKIEPDAHIFMDSKASWYRPGDTLPKYCTGRSSEKFENH